MQTAAVDAPRLRGHKLKGSRGNGGGVTVFETDDAGLVVARHPTDLFRAELARRRDRAATHGRRGWLVRRALAAADALGIALAFAVAMSVFHATVGDRIQPSGEVFLFLVTLPMWLVLAKLQGLYERDEERADHSTMDELAGVVVIVTLGTWFFEALSWMTGLASPQLERLVVFWLLAILFVTTGRAVARTLARRASGYAMRTVVLGAGEIGQLVARKIGQHPEYGLDLIGFVDADPLDRRVEARDVIMLGGLDRLQELVAAHRVDRVIVAFSNEPDAETMAVVRSLRDRDVIVDVVPRLFELVGPRASMHLLEGMPLVVVPPARLSRSSMTLKRLLDIVVASIGLVLTTPLFAVAAYRIKRESPGPVIFRQERLGLDMRPFTCLKFRTMRVETDPDEHRAYVESIARSDATMNGNGMYKLERRDAVTPFGHWLRKTSLDEIPQLLNVLRGDMSIVGPRPCIPYEVECFEAHHVERFLVPQGITGLWQVSARANSTFGEALDMDVAYVRGWSLGLDLKLLCRTPVALLRQRRATA
jgi:exopolysaccharide biosynthesis polyprenyl glycosylphosphotransferase